MKQLSDNQNNVISLIWQGDTANASPGYSSRGSLYGVGAIPHAQFQGHIADVGGGSTYPRYLNYYNNTINTDSPAEIEVSLDFNAQGQLIVQGDIFLHNAITTTNNKVVFALTRFINSDYYCSAAGYATQDFSLNSAGESGNFSHAFTLDPTWNLGDLKGIVMIQSWQSKYIVQAAQTGFTGLVPIFSANVTTGPPALGVQFIDYSMPATGIESWEWDFNGDGVMDSTEQNPYYLYEQPGNYTVSLKITKEGEVQENIKENFIQVSAIEPISGNLSGIWTADWNPYIISADVTIQANDQLQIEPGVVIYSNNESLFQVAGSLQAIGESANPVLFSSTGSWKGIRFNSTNQINILRNCHITKATNTAVFVTSSTVEITENAIFDNFSSSSAGAIELSNASNVIIQQNFIANNSSNTSTGGIGCTASSPSIKNNIIVNNQANPAMPATAGAFVLKNSSNPFILNNTISNNVATNAFFVVNSQPVIENSIVMHNGQIIYEIASLVTVNYSCISGNFIGLGNIDTDPLFAQASAGSGTEFSGFSGLWYVMENSPVIDAGNADEMYNDVEDSSQPGNPLWPAMGTLRNDMGAFGGSGFPNFMDFVKYNDTAIPVTVNQIISNYPNPFNPQTTIQFQMPDIMLNKPVHIAIYNIRGQVVKQIVKNQLTERNFSYVWQGIDEQFTIVSSGVYFVMVTNGKDSFSKKMLLLK